MLSVEKLQSLFKSIQIEVVSINHKQVNGLNCIINEYEAKLNVNKGNIYCLFQLINKAYPWGGLGILASSKIFVPLKNPSTSIDIIPKKILWFTKPKYYIIESNDTKIKTHLNKSNTILNSLKNLSDFKISSTSKIESHSFSYPETNFLQFRSKRIVSAQHLRTIINIFNEILLILSEFK